MKTQIQNALIYRSGAFVPGDLYIENGVIVEALSGAADEVIDAQGARLIPGMIDVHTHGAANVDVNAADYAGYSAISSFMATQGTTGFLCSILTDTPEQTEWCIREALKAQRDGLPGAQLLGIHLEGPFLAPEYKGAMPEYLLRKGDAALFRHYQEVAEGTVRYMTVSPEVDGVRDMIADISGEVCVAIGHSGATYDCAMDAIAKGARASTHTFNAMRLFHQHEPAIMGAVMESDVYCEAICDGRHLHPASVRLLLKCKGYDRVVAVTDSIMAAGLPDGQYKLGVNDVTVENGDAKLTTTGVRAGSTLTQQQALQNLMRFTGEPMERVVCLLSENPARMLCLSDKGSLECGKAADITMVNEEGRVLRTIVGGKTVYQA